MKAQGKALFEGRVKAEAMVLEDWLSFGGGLDPESGRIVDQHHPQVGECVTGKVVVLPGVRGSAGSPSTLAESIRLGTGPCGIILGEAETSSLAAAFAAKELYEVTVPVVVLAGEEYDALKTGQQVGIDETGLVATIDDTDGK